MDMTIDQQVALDEALVPHASRLRIGKRNFCLRSDITSKELTIEVATDIVHHHSIHFKMNNKKRINNLEYFREMLHICPRIPNQTFDELPFKEEILAFLRYLRHSREIKKITDVNINKLHQAWRSFAAVINKCLSGKSRLRQSSDFVYQVEQKDAKKSNEMYYPRFIKVIINFFMTKDPSIPRRNKVNWHYVMDDQMFMTIKLVSRHQSTRQFGAMLPVELTNEDIRNSATYEYYAIASGAAPPKTKASVRMTQSSSDTTMPPPTAAGTRLSTLAKGKQPIRSSKAKDLSMKELVLYQGFPIYQLMSLMRKYPGNNDDDEFVHPKLSTHDEEAKEEESFDPIVQTSSHVENSDDERNDDEIHGMNVGGDEGPDVDDDDDGELYRDVNINLEGRDVQMTDVHTTQVLKDTHVTLTPVNPDGIDSLFESTHQVDLLVTTKVVPLLVTSPTLYPPFIPIISQVQQAPAPSPTTALSTSLQDLLNFGSLFGFDHRLKTLEANFSENLYKALVDAYECDKIIMDTYGDTVTLKRRRDDEDKDEEPSAGSNRGSKRRRACKEPESTSAPKEKASTTSSKSIKGFKSHQKTASKSAPAEEPMQTTQDLEEPTHLEFETGVADVQPIAEASQHPECDLAKQADSHTSFNELMDTPVDFLAFLMNRLKVDTMTPELLAGPTYELMKGSCKLTNLTVEECFAFNVSLRMFTISIVIQRHVEDLQLGVESYQKKLNLKKPDTYICDLKRKEAYTTYSNPREFIYQNKDKQNRNSNEVSTSDYQEKK
nr:hypothetical protein [Tanacetum cinerariifolium]